MKLLLLFTLISGFSLAQTWEQLDDFGGSERDDCVCFAIGSKVYCGTGMDAGFQVTRDFYAFDFGTETWSQVASLPEGKQRMYAASFVYNDQGYVLGGVDTAGNYLSDLWRYSPETDTWTELFGLPTEGRGGASCFVIGDTAYIVGGKTAMSPAVPEVWAYVIPSNGWSQRAPVPQEMWRGVAFEHGGKGYAGLGLDGGWSAPGNINIYRYHPTQDTWELVPELVFTERAYVEVTTVNDFVFLFGGAGPSGFLSSFERIDMSSLTVDALSSFPSDARRGGGAFTNGQDFFTVNGVSATERKKETWVARGILGLEDLSMSEVHVGLQDGKYLVIEEEDVIDVFELLDITGTVVLRRSDKSLDVSHLTPGVYFYRVLSKYQQSSGKVVLY